MANYFERIKQLRREKKITQGQLAQVLGVTPNAYQKYEYGMREPGLDTFIALAKYFDVSLDYLVGISGEKGRR